MIKNVLQRLAPVVVIGGAGLGLWWIAREPPAGDGRHLQGVVEMDETALAFEVPGRVVGIAVKKGDRVKAGQRIAWLDDTLARATTATRREEARAVEEQAKLVKQGARPAEVKALKARVQSARAAEELLRKTERRQRTLVADHAIPEAGYEEVQAKLDRAAAEREALEFTLRNLRDGARAPEIAGASARAQAAAKAAELEEARLSKHALLAPRDGEIVEVPVEAGEVVGAGAVVATLAASKTPYVDVFVPQARMAGIKIGGRAEVRIDALATSLPGQVTEIGRRTEFSPRYLFSEAERSTFVVRVRVSVADPEEKLVAGVPAFVTLSEAR